MIGFYTNLYYNAIVMYTIYYFFASLQKVKVLNTILSLLKIAVKFKLFLYTVIKVLAMILFEVFWPFYSLEFT